MFTHIDVVVPPEEEPVEIEELKPHARVVGDQDDEKLWGMIVAAREKAETFTRRSLMTQTLDVWYDDPSGVGYLEIPRGTVQEVVGLYTYDSYNDETVIDSGEYSLVGTDLILSGWFPNYRLRRGIKIRIISGYGDNPEDVPASIRQGILEYATHLFENRLGEAPSAKYAVQATGSGSLPPTVESLWRPHQIKMV